MLNSSVGTNKNHSLVQAKMELTFQGTWRFLNGLSVRLPTPFKAVRAFSARETEIPTVSDKQLPKRPLTSSDLDAKLISVIL